MSKSKIRILLADDHALMRMGLKSLLNVQRDMHVVGEAEDGEEAVRAAESLRPDVVVMDLAMPGVGGAEATRRIADAHLGAKVVILTAFGDSADVGKALARGACGAQMKGGPTDELLAAIRAVHAGGTAIAPEIRRLLDKRDAAADLSERQIEILACVARGLKTSVIAEELGISVGGVKQHLSRICLALGASNRSEAAAIAIARHLVKL
ncbi:MAG: response regulator transcription factor [Kiritimatiellae bacterium]|nr:response regulator transcription factor [Kiritimatiellia bacterium]